MSRSKTTRSASLKKSPSYQATATMHSLVIHCREWRSKAMRKLEVDVGIQPTSLVHRGLDFVICIRKFWVRARFPDGEVLIVKPPLDTTAPIGNLTIGSTKGEETQVGGSGEVSTALKAILSLQKKRSLQNAMSFAAPLHVVEQFKSVLSSESHVAEWRIVLIDPKRLANAKQMTPLEIIDEYIQNLGLEAHAQRGISENPTAVSLDLDFSSYFILSKRRQTKWGAFIDSLRYTALRGTKREEELIASAVGAAAACELSAVTEARP